MSTNHLSQASGKPQNTTQSNERSTNRNHETAQWTRNVLGCFSCLVVCIVVFGAIDLYWHLVWQYTSDVLTRGGTSLWPSCILGAVASVVGFLAIGQPYSRKFLAIILLSMFSWVVCFAAATFSEIMDKHEFNT